MLWLAIILGAATFMLLIAWIMLMDPHPADKVTMPSRPLFHDPPRHVTVLPHVFDQDHPLEAT